MARPEKHVFVRFIGNIQNAVRLGVPNRVIMDMCEMVGKYFCNCQYVEYFVFDLDFGRNTGYTEMGYELRDVKSIKQFVDFLFSLDAQNES